MKKLVGLLLILAYVLGMAGCKLFLRQILLAPFGGNEITYIMLIHNCLLYKAILLLFRKFPIPH